MSTFNLSQHCNFPTHKLGNTLDIIISSSFTNINNLNSELFHFSDHYFISFTIPLSQPLTNSSSTIIKRSWTNFDKISFTNLFLSSGFSSTSFSDVDAFMNEFNSTISSLLDILAPFKSFRYRLTSRKAPWFDHDCILLKQSVRKSERVYRSTISTSSWYEWKTCPKSYRTLLFDKNSSYLRQSIISLSNSKNRWSSLSKLLNKNSPPPSFSPDDYLSYITTKIKNIRDTSSNNSSPIFTKFSTEFLSSFSPITLSHLTKIINSMSSTTCSLDLIPTPLFKELSSLFYPILLDLINLSLSTSKFPSVLKSSFIIPTIKNASLDPSSLSSYRPVSNLSFISKILEKVVYEQFNSYLNKFSLLPSSQSGFRIGHSTETALLKLYNDLIVSSDSKLSTLLLCLDFSSAFDTVDHSLLLNVLDKSFNITDSCLSWVKSYLSNRSSYVSIESSKSAVVSLTYGVPQGSILGPLLFILYTSELPNIISSFSLDSQMYADDSYIYSSFSDSSLDSVVNKITLCLHSIISWSSSMCLKLNPDKFELIYFNRSSKSLSRLPSLALPPPSSLSITPSSLIRSLGFIFDSNLTLTPQILSVSKSCYFHIRRIKQLLPLLDDPTLQLLVSSLILSRIDYCNSLYYDLPDTTLSPLTKAFNSAARLVSRTSRFSHISPSLVLLHWLPLRYRVIFKICVIMFKIHNCISPIYLLNLIKKPPKLGLRSSTHNRSFILPVEHSFAKRSFSYSGPFLWNSLPSSLTTSESLAAFRHGLKTFLFRRFVAERF